MGSADDGRNEFDPVEGSILSAVLLKRMAKVLELTQPVDISTLARRVEAALMEYQAFDKTRPPKPKDIRKTFDNLERSHRQLMDSLNRLGRGERAPPFSRRRISGAPGADPHRP